MSKIREILNKFNINGHDKIGGTDKDTTHSYVEIYEQLLEPILEKDGSLLEIGIQYGGSILLWKELLKNCRIFGFDIEDKLSDSIKEYVKDYPKKITLEFKDAYCKETIDHIKFIYPRGFDVIIDDGPHTEESQLKCIELYLELLKDDGVLIIEDIQNFESIKVFIENIPESKFFDYEPLVFDLRDKKNRYDDVIFTIKKKVKKPTNKIAIFYHVGQFGDWKRLFHDQINSLVVSGLYHICDFIHIGVNGDEILPLSFPKFRVQYNNNKILEADTLKSLYDFCLDNKEHRVLYFHTKGSTQESTSRIVNVTKWRYYLEYFSIHNWKDCVTSLKEYDTSGAEYLFESGLINQDTGITEWEQNSHYSGNYWWANASYICKLDPNYLYRTDKGWDRYRSEFWIGTGNPNRRVFYNTDIFDKYGDWGSLISPDYVKKEEFNEPSLLKKKMNTKKTKIVMISMFKNESKGIRRMLESVYKHIDFYVFQDNGSTDGTPDIVKEFFADKDIPGFIYNVEEGWVGFGWNRDHLLQTCLKTDHGCDWIMKMDCDEYLEVDDDFDWSPFYNTNTESFHVTAQNPGCVYYRAWIWNAKLPWKFQHDPAHEVIYLDNEKGENFERVNLPRGLRMVGTNDGESYTVRTKYITDALKLEERLIREETMLTDTYHFWYIAKSYMDCYAGDFYALGQEHSKEFARRFIFYFKEYLKHMNVSGIHEMSYFSAFSIGLGYKYLKEYEKAIEWFNAAEKYCPVRNEHIVHLAQTYDELQQYDKMLEQTTRLINPERKLPFPDYYFLIDNNIYCDSGDYPQYIHDYALSKISEEKSINSFSINITTKPRLWIVDDFYADPHAVREFALQQEFDPNLDYYKGSRTKDQYIVPGTKEAFEKIIGKKITNWTETHGMCGRFQYCTAEDALVYHCDGQTLAGMIYLTPDAPFSCGTSLYAHKDTKLRNENDFEDINVFEGGFYDKSKFELVDTAGNVFNRLVLFDAKCIHSANEYFGTNLTNSRLFHLFFFD
jgi:tetratricopeptide (TPR) repeat protein